MPFIVNTKAVKHDDELIVQCYVPLAKAKQEKKPATWADQLSEDEKKRPPRRRTSGCG